MKNSSTYHYLRRIAAEPPFRLASRWLVQKFSRNVETRARWGADAYPYYQFGILQGACSAKIQGHTAITVVEFGVYTGVGLLNMEKYATQIEMSTGVHIKVVGFDSGHGLPSFIGDYRDHPDQWSPGSYKMANFEELANRIDPMRTQLIIGNVSETVPKFLEGGNFATLGFIAFDLDLYSSTRDALEILRSPKRKMLRQTPVYFDDINFITNHRWAGELAAIDEFNSTCESVKIDCWYNIRHDKPFPEAHYWEKMMVAHDLPAISAVDPSRGTMGGGLVR